MTETKGGVSQKNVLTRDSKNTRMFRSRKHCSSSTKLQMICKLYYFVQYLRGVWFHSLVLCISFLRLILWIIIPSTWPSLLSTSCWFMEESLHLMCIVYLKPGTNCLAKPTLNLQDSYVFHNFSPYLTSDFFYTPFLGGDRWEFLDFRSTEWKCELQKLSIRELSGSYLSFILTRPKSHEKPLTCDSNFHSVWCLCVCLFFSNTSGLLGLLGS